MNFILIMKIDIFEFRFLFIDVLKLNFMVIDVLNLNLFIGVLRANQGDFI